MSEDFVQTIELTIKPEFGDTVDSITVGFLPYVRSLLKEKDKEYFLDNGEISVELEETFPTNEVVTILIHIVTGTGLVIYEEWLRNKLQERYRINEQKKIKNENELVGEGKQSGENQLVGENDQKSE